jgi:hypothetical protein
MSCLSHPAGASPPARKAFTSMAAQAPEDTTGTDQKVFGGADSHTDTLHVAVISDNGGHLADAEFTTTPAGYAAALAFLNAHGSVRVIGVEGTSSYGAGFTRAARTRGHQVIEVNRPDKAERRRIGKSDPIDAYYSSQKSCPELVLFVVRSWRGLLKSRAGLRSWSPSSRRWRAGSVVRICGGGCRTTSAPCWRRWAARTAGNWPSMPDIVTLLGCSTCSTVPAGTPMPFETTCASTSDNSSARTAC